MTNTSSDLIYIRQSIRSDYCAVYSTAMFLSLKGQAVDKPTALKLFGVRRGTWTGATYDQIRKAIYKYDDAISTRWIHTKPTTRQGFFRVSHARWEGVPILATVFCQHRHHKISDWRVFVVVSVTQESVNILDPLSKVPAQNESWNVKVLKKAQYFQNVLYVSGAAWEIDLRHPISFLEAI